MIFAVPLGLALALCSILVWVVTDRAAKGKITRNGLVGIKVPTTLSSDEGWLVGHQAALPMAKWIGILGSVVALVLIVVGGFSELEPTPPLVVVRLIAYAAFLIAAIILAVVAHRAAKEVDAPKSPKS